MTDLVRMYIRNVAIGFVLALVFTGALLALNVANLWHLVTHTQGGVIAVLMLVVFNTIVFAGVQFAIAVMKMAEPEDKTPRGPRAPSVSRTPVRVPVASKHDVAHNRR